MSDNDLIKRGEVRKLAAPLETEDGEILVVDMDDVDEIPAVPRETTAREFLKARNRLCTSFESGACSECPLYGWCGDDEVIWDMKLLNIVEKWAREHSEERSEE